MSKQKKITLIPSGYGHYRITALYRGKEVSTVTNNVRAIDDYRSDEDERDHLNRKRQPHGYRTLMALIAQAYRESK